MPRHWRLSALLPMPRLIETPEGSLPPQLTFLSIVPVPLSVQLEDRAWVLASIPEHPYAERVAPREPTRLTTTLVATDAEVALQQVAGSFEGIVDFLAFQVQQPIRVIELELLDVTPPVKVGDDREALLFPAFDGYDFPKFQRSHFLGGTSITTRVTLDVPGNWREQHARAALDWYIKAMAAAADADRFMLFWIAMEVIYDQSDVRVSQPPRCPRGHLQPTRTCAECGASNEQVVRGASIQQFLTERADLSPETAKQMWRLRQMFHGAVAFDPSALTQLTTLTIRLRAATLALIKDRLGWDPTSPPILEWNGPSVLATALGIVRAVVQSDLD